MTITTQPQDQEGGTGKLSLNHLSASSIKLLSKDCLTSNCLALGWSTNFSAFAIALSITLSEGGKRTPVVFKATLQIRVIVDSGKSPQRAFGGRGIFSGELLSFVQRA
jgi:hypothetical protein